MNLNEAIEAAKTSPLLSKFELEQMGTLTTMLKMLAYAASHPETQGTEPPFEQIEAFMSANPDLVQIYNKVALCILQELDKLEYPKVPDHAAFAEALYAPLGSLLSIAKSGELRPSMDQIQEVLDQPATSILLDRAFTILWTIFYPGAPVANGKTYSLESFAAECKAPFEA